MLATRAAATLALPRIGLRALRPADRHPGRRLRLGALRRCGAFSHFVDGAQIAPSGGGGGGGGGGGFSVVAGSSGAITLWWVAGIFTPRAWLARGARRRLPAPG